MPQTKDLFKKSKHIVKTIRENQSNFSVIQMQSRAMQWQLLRKIQTLGINVCLCECVHVCVCLPVWGKTPDAMKFMQVQMKMQIFDGLYN